MCRQSEKVRPEQTWQTFASEDVSTMQTWSDEQQDLGGNKGLMFPFLFASISLQLPPAAESPVCTTFMPRKRLPIFCVLKESNQRRAHF